MKDQTRPRRKLTNRQIQLAGLALTAVGIVIAAASLAVAILK